MSRIMGRTTRNESRWSIPLVLWTGLLGLLIVGIGSCSKAPEAELQAASAAIEQAKQSEAEVYAPTEYGAAVDSLSAAKVEVDRQNAKFVLFRKYQAAAEKATAAQAAAVSATEAAGRNKELARREAEKTLADTTKELADARSLLEGPAGKKLFRAKEAKEAINIIVSEIDATDAALEGIREQLRSEQYRAASRMGHVALEKAQALRKEIQTAIDKMTVKPS